ncbi:MAG: hypothetical protein ACTHK8_18465 [Ginsengibacter sp.]
MEITESDIKKSMSTLEVHPSIMLSYYESKIEETEKVLAELKSKYSFLKRKIRNNSPFEITELNMKIANIKWRDEIRRCITPENDEFSLATSSEISSCIAYNHNIEILTREIKSKISSTLSLMFREGEIGRVGGENGKDYLYGVKEYFNSDGITINIKFKDCFKWFMENRDQS